MRVRRSLTVAAAAVAVTAATVLPAGAHPFFSQDGASAPAGSLTTLTLAMAHGCGTEDDAGGDATLEVAMEVPEQFSYLVPLEVEGYEVSVEGEEGQVPEVVTWTAADDGAALPAPEVTMEAVVDGEPGDEIHVRVFQGCDGFSYRWVGTPDEPADDPAVRLVLTDPDPDAPPPPDQPAEPVATPDAEAPDADADDGAETAEEPTEPEAETEEPTAVEDLPTEPPEDEGTGLGWLPIVVGAVVLAGLGALLAARRRAPIEDPAAGDGTGMSPPADDR